jgi:hypothetical protein
VSLADSPLGGGEWLAITLIDPSRWETQQITPAFILEDSFIRDTFRPLKHEVIENVLACHDILAVMTTDRDMPC